MNLYRYCLTVTLNNIFLQFKLLSVILSRCSVTVGPQEPWMMMNMVLASCTLPGWCAGSLLLCLFYLSALGLCLLSCPVSLEKYLRKETVITQIKCSVYSDCQSLLARHMTKQVIKRFALASSTENLKEF